MHWGIEYSIRPNKIQKHIAKYLHSIGVSAVIGAHPHVLQGHSITPYHGLTAYSIGNFLFPKHGTNMSVSSMFQCYWIYKHHLFQSFIQYSSYIFKQQIWKNLPETTDSLSFYSITFILFHLVFKACKPLKTRAKRNRSSKQLLKDIEKNEKASKLFYFPI